CRRRWARPSPRRKPRRSESARTREGDPRTKERRASAYPTSDVEVVLIVQCGEGSSGFRSLARRALAHEALVGYRAIPAAVLGVVERLVGALNELLLVDQGAPLRCAPGRAEPAGTPAILGHRGDPERERDREGSLVRRDDELGDVLADALGELCGAGGVGAVHDDGELLAAVARDDVDLAHAVA